jgi:hypothetical protein
MCKWKDFERLVARIHSVLDPELYEVAHNVRISEPGGGSHQVDVLLKPKRGFAGPVLVSCKSGGHSVGVDHVREWADVVQNTGASAGVIVAEAGFTNEAKTLASVPSRRLTLWMPRRLTLEDFAPDGASEIQEDGTRAGYVCSVHMDLVLREPRPKPETMKLEVEPVGPRTGKTVSHAFSQSTRNDWYLRDEHDRVVGNLWDLYVEAAKQLERSGAVEVVPDDPRFLVLGGVRQRFKSLAVEIEMVNHVREIDVDVREDALAYENAVTGEVKLVPLPASVLDAAREHDNM